MPAEDGRLTRMFEQLSLEDQILVALRRITRAIDLRSRTLLQDYGLTAPQLTTLQAIWRLQAAPAGRIAREVHLGQPTVTGILTRLEQRGLIRRVRGDQDRRNVNVSLTEEGSRVLSEAPSLLQDAFRRELLKLQQWERTQILATLQRIADMMYATQLDAVPVLESELADQGGQSPIGPAAPDMAGPTRESTRGVQESPSCRHPRQADSCLGGDGDLESITHLP